MNKLIFEIMHRQTTVYDAPSLNITDAEALAVADELIAEYLLPRLESIHLLGALRRVRGVL